MVMNESTLTMEILKKIAIELLITIASADEEQMCKIIEQLKTVMGFKTYYTSQITGYAFENICKEWYVGSLSN